VGMFFVRDVLSKYIAAQLSLCLEIIGWNAWSKNSKINRNPNRNQNLKLVTRMIESLKFVSLSISFYTDCKVKIMFMKEIHRLETQIPAR